MDWHLKEAASIFHHLPHSFHDLLHHEDKALVASGIAGLRIIRPVSSPPRSAIEKDIDPSIARSQQNFGLLIQDYLRTLPEFSSETQQSEALLDHWRKILLEQPQRLAEAHLDSWNNERSKGFWHERLSHYKTDFGVASDHFPIAMDDWERSAGAAIVPLEALGGMKTKQWQDLVIRQRLHQLDLQNMSRYKV